MSSPTIWYVHPYAGGPGVGRYNRPYELAHAWQAEGVNALVITAAFHHLLDEPGRHRGALDVEGVPYEFLPTPAYDGNGIGRLVNMTAFTAALPIHARRLARRYGRPDMVVASSPHPYTFLTSHRLARRFGARSVFEVRDLWPLSLVELAGVRPTHPLVRVTDRLERHAYGRADAVVSLLPQTLPYMAERGLEASRWYYIPNGVDTHAPRIDAIDSEPVKQAQRWRADGRLVVVYAGAMGAPNYVQSLVESVTLLRQRGDDRIAVIIVGRGEQSAAIRQEIVEQGLSDRIALFDQIPKRNIPALLDACQVGYLSLRPEPLFRFGVSPNKLFDYMLARLPVLFAIEAGNDPVAECNAGISVSPGDIPGIADALAAFADLPEQARTEMGQRGLEYVMRQHSYDALAARYLEILDTQRNTR
ncbi:glycosyltransferase family 4 protein [Thauera sp. 2A1]|uniref:glycosyltransferase family 4 protein n=1 Tax=Thauera sp. 2A1 TaxID=2570191 RepID=UPI001291849E|nr:glycosyltransferase family 4 protein [Thauera sp. 2A1]KAI5914817.1 glycosyltransferase family 4 protein [Thauera sp. 2A1]